jgi:hypothetical protein
MAIAGRHVTFASSDGCIVVFRPFVLDVITVVLIRSNTDHEVKGYHGAFPLRALFLRCYLTLALGVSMSPRHPDIDRPFSFDFLNRWAWLVNLAGGGVNGDPVLDLNYFFSLGAFCSVSSRFYRILL